MLVRKGSFCHDLNEGESKESRCYQHRGPGDATRLITNKTDTVCGERDREMWMSRATRAFRVSDHALL